GRQSWLAPPGGRWAGSGQPAWAGWPGLARSGW
nr:hypothetical protein [Tanacetum cinerariifolium]